MERIDRRRGRAEAIGALAASVLREIGERIGADWTQGTEQQCFGISAIVRTGVDKGGRKDHSPSPRLKQERENGDRRKDDREDREARKSGKFGGHGLGPRFSETCGQSRALLISQDALFPKWVLSHAEGMQIAAFNGALAHFRRHLPAAVETLCTNSLEDAHSTLLALRIDAGSDRIGFFGKDRVRLASAPLTGAQAGIEAGIPAGAAHAAQSCAAGASGG